MAAAKIGVMGVVIGLGVLGAARANPPAAAPGNAAHGGHAAAVAKPNMADHALRMLKEGNERFVEGKPVHPNTDVFRVADTGGNGQHPFAAIVTCADSRVAVERLFDRGVGDLFVVRVAGNVCDPNESGSVEYACEHLGTQLVVVMGHSKCGAVKAAIAGAEAGKNVGSLLDNIAPAVAHVKSAHPELEGEALADAVVRQNVWQGVEDMFKGSATMRELAGSGRVKVVGAVYDVTTGAVEWMGSHPAQVGLLKHEEMSETAMAPTVEPSSKSAEKSDKTEKADKGEKSPAEKTGFVKPTGPSTAGGAKKPAANDGHGESTKPASTQAGHHGHH